MIRVLFSIFIVSLLSGCGTPKAAPASGSSQGPSISSDGIQGSVEAVSVTGSIGGTARLIASPTTPLQVQFYVDGPVGVGVSIGSTTANLAGLNNQGINDRFRFQLAAADADGMTHMLYVYVNAGGVLKALPGTPVSFIAYTPKVAGENFYNSTLKAKLQTNCGGCHAVTYEGHYVSLAKLMPALGGLAANNELINKASASVSHGGGNRCSGGKSSGLCADIQTWWNLEFK